MTLKLVKSLTKYSCQYLRDTLYNNRILESNADEKNIPKRNHLFKSIYPISAVNVLQKFDVLHCFLMAVYQSPSLPRPSGLEMIDGEAILETIGVERVESPMLLVRIGLEIEEIPIGLA